MSQSQSFSGKICPRCSKCNFILDNNKLSYTNSGTSIQSDTYKIKHQWVKHLSNGRKVQEVTAARNPLSNLSRERSINPLKITV